MSAFFRYVFFLQADGFVSNGSLIAAIWKSCDGHRWAIDGPSMGLNGVSVREWLVQIGNNNNKYSSNCIYYQDATSLHFTFMTSGPIRIISSLNFGNHDVLTHPVSFLVMPPDMRLWLGSVSINHSSFTLIAAVWLPLAQLLQLCRSRVGSVHFHHQICCPILLHFFILLLRQQNSCFRLQG